MKRKWASKVFCESANNFEIGPRWQSWLRDQAYRGRHAAKRIATDWNVSEGTARLWLSGKRPTTEYLDEAVRRWGWSFIAFIYEPVAKTGSYDQNISADLRAMEERLARLEATEHAGIRAVPGSPNDGVSPAPSKMVGDGARPNAVADHVGGAR